VEKREDRILPCLDGSDEAESSPESCDIDSLKDGSLNRSTDEAADIAKHANGCDALSFAYVTGVSGNVNLFSLP